MLIIDSHNEVLHRENHTAVIPPDDGGPITFRWHFPRGVLSLRMSGAELAVFVVEHMFAILDLGLVSSHRRVESEFRGLLQRLVKPVDAEQVSGGGCVPVHQSIHAFHDGDRLIVREHFFILRSSVDEILSWIRVEFHEEEDDIIYMNINDQTPVTQRRTTFIMPGLN